MNLETRYLNMTLRSPLLVSALPLSESLDNLKRMEDAGAGAVVLYSLFEEQVRLAEQIFTYHRENPRATTEDARKLFPKYEQFRIGLEAYLDHIHQAKENLSIPIIASLNCQSFGGWTDIAQQIGEAGADALELNIYHIPTDMDRSSEQVEDTILTILKIVKTEVKIPVVVKLSPYFTNLANFARRLDHAGANGLVLFNRFYQPDFDPKTLKMNNDIPLGHPRDSRLALHWISILYGYLKTDLAATGGIYTAEDIVKFIMVGARVTLLASVLLQKGIGYLLTLEQDLRQWMEDNDYESVDSMHGIMRQFHSRDSSAFERAEYIRTIKAYVPKP